jgi:hypothetical protein
MAAKDMAFAEVRIGHQKETKFRIEGGLLWPEFQ